MSWFCQRFRDFWIVRLQRKYWKVLQCERSLFTRQIPKNLPVLHRLYTCLQLRDLMISGPYTLCLPWISVWVLGWQGTQGSNCTHSSSSAPPCVFHRHVASLGSYAVFQWPGTALGPLMFLLCLLVSQGTALRPSSFTLTCYRFDFYKSSLSCTGVGKWLE